MADIELTTANKVEVVKMIEGYTLRAGEAIVAGAPITINTSGDWVNSDANGTTSLLNTRAVSTKTVTIGAALTGMKRGIMDGFVFAGAYMSGVYASNTVGRLADAAGTSSIPLGRVVPGTGVPPITTSPDKVLYVDISWQEDLIV